MGLWRDSVKLVRDLGIKPEELEELVLDCTSDLVAKDRSFQAVKFSLEYPQIVEVGIDGRMLAANYRVSPFSHDRWLHKETGDELLDSPEGVALTKASIARVFSGLQHSFKAYVRGPHRYEARGLATPTGLIALIPVTPVYIEEKGECVKHHVSRQYREPTHFGSGD